MALELYVLSNELSIEIINVEKIISLLIRFIFARYQNLNTCSDKYFHT